VAAAVVGFGATFSYPVIQLVAERGDRRALPFAMTAILAISKFVAVPATLLVGAWSSSARWWPSSSRTGS